MLDPIELIRRLSETYADKIERKFYIYLPDDAPNIPLTTEFCVGTSKQKKFVGIAVETHDLEKSTDEVFAEVCSFIESNSML